MQLCIGFLWGKCYVCGPKKAILQRAAYFIALWIDYCL
jgi:hypothetical protein